MCVMSISTLCSAVCSAAHKKTSKLQITGLCEEIPFDDFIVAEQGWRGVTRIVYKRLGNVVAKERRLFICSAFPHGLGPGSAVDRNGASFNCRRQAIIWTNAGIFLIGPLGTNFVKYQSKFMHFHSRKRIWKYHLENGGHLVSVSMC